MNVASIMVLLKPGKDRLYPESYSPISLLNSDVKILAKVLANSLSKVLQQLVHPDQSGFIPTKLTANNIRRLYLNQQLPSDNVGDRTILSLDAAKAFDSMEWPYLWEVLNLFGLGKLFIGWVKLLYSAPKATMQVNGSYSDVFSLHRGTRQGCPLYPLLFALLIKLLAVGII